MKTKVASPDTEFSILHQDLIEACRKGDQKAQFQIYKLYYKAMYNISLRIVRDTMEAEDIMQESFLSAFEKIGSYSGKVSFGAWLRKIVHNRSLDYLERKRKFCFEDIDSIKCMEAEGVEVNCQDDPDPRVKKITDRIKLLPVKYRNIISLYLLEGYDHEEIGQILSIPSSTSRSLFSRARQKILGGIQGLTA